MFVMGLCPHDFNNMCIFIFWIFRKCVMKHASGLFVKTCLQLWKDGNTPPELKESDLHFRKQITVEDMDSDDTFEDQTCR